MGHNEANHGRKQILRGHEKNLTKLEAINNPGRSKFLIRGNRVQNITTINKWRSTEHAKPIIKNNFLIYDVILHNYYVS